jgi:nucleotide-binding universal stress UspA family protein
VPAVTRVLVPVDFSPSAREALDYASFLAERLGAELLLLHVWEPPGYVGPDTLGLLPLATEPPAWERTRAEVEREVERLVAASAARQGRVSIRVEAGQAADVILRVAKEAGADLVVMGTHGRTGLSRLLVGSVAEAVLRRSTCPVLTLRVATSAAHEPVPPRPGGVGGAP